MIRSIGLTVGSALGASVLDAHTEPGRALPDVDGFRVALFIAVGLCVATMVVSYALPGRAPGRPRAMSDHERKEFDEMLAEEADLAGSGFILAEEPSPFGNEENPE